MKELVLSKNQKKILIEKMVSSARKGNLANAGLVLDGDSVVASSESWVVSSCDATAHSERMLVEMVCKLRHNNSTPGLTMVSVVEPCLMCLSACSQAGYTQLAYIIRAEKYVKQIPWMSDGIKIDKERIAGQLSNPVGLVHLKNYENEFSQVFERAMERLHTA